MTFTSKQDALDALEASRAEWLAAARAWAAQWAAQGDGTVTINDVRRYGPRVPQHVDPRVCGAVFRQKGTWQLERYESSNRRTSHGRPIARFRLVG